MLQTGDSAPANRANPHLQPMRLTEILDGTFSLYRNNFRLFFHIALVYFGAKFCLNLLSRFVFSKLLPSLNASDFISVIPLEGTLLTSAAVFLTLAFSTVTDFVDEVVPLLVAGGIGLASAYCYLGRTVTPFDAFRQVLRRFWPFFGYISVWYLLDSWGLWRIIRMPFVIYYLSIGGGFESIAFLWVAYLGTPLAIYLGIRWGFGALPILFEGTSFGTALRRSSELVKGTWWRVFVIYVAIFLLWWTLSTILHTTLDILLQFIGVTTGDNIIEQIIKMRQLMEDPGAFDTDFPQYSFFSYLMNMLTGLGIATFLLPVLYIGFMLLYFDLRIRKEGFDIEMMVKNRESID